ncbi:uncharacterized protein [Diadema antillarum]|uniref:uncharacterized protein n=1 Tax=Diadema antillarum TaxID=105358 RepID=UPI003A86D2B1
MVTQSDFIEVFKPLVTEAVSAMTIMASNNTTDVDVAVLGCICQFDRLACARNGILSLVVVIMGVLCLVRVAKLIDIGRRYHQVAVFSLASVECLVIMFHWLFMSYPWMELATQFLKMTQLVIVCHFYLARSVRLLRKEYLNKLVVLPVLVLFGLYFLAVTVAGIIFTKSLSNTCGDPFWVMLSAMECVLVQMFMCCGVYITKKLNEVTTLRSTRWKQKRDLWSIIIAFELSSIATLIYDSYMLGSMDGLRTCSDIYHDSNVSYSIVYLVLMFFKIIVPILTLLIVFHPVDRDPDGDLVTDYNSFSSTFSPTHPYRRLYPSGPDPQNSIQHASRSPARRSQSFPRMPIIKEEAEPLPPAQGLPVSA